MLLAHVWYVERYKSTMRHILQSKEMKLKSAVLPEGRLEGIRVY